MNERLGEYSHRFYTNLNAKPVVYLNPNLRIQLTQKPRMMFGFKVGFFVLSFFAPTSNRQQNHMLTMKHALPVRAP